MEESEEDRLKREQLIKAYNACKEALDTINKLSINSTLEDSSHLSNNNWKTNVTSSLNTALQNRVISRAAPPLPPNKPALYQNRTRSNNLPANGVNGKIQR